MIRRTTHRCRIDRHRLGLPPAKDVLRYGNACFDFVRDRALTLKHAMVAYEISLAERGKPTQSLPLDNFDGNGASLICVFAAYIKGMPADRLVAEKDRHFGQPHEVKAAGKTLRFRIVSGTSGILSVIKDPEAKGPGYQRTANDVEQINFNVCVVQPPDAHVGFLLIETVANRSVGQAFRTMFTAGFRRRFPDVTLTLSRTAQTDAWKAAEEAGQSVSVKTLTAIHRGIAAETMQDMGIGGTARPVGEYRQILDFKKDPQPSSILKKTREAFFGPDSTGIDATRGTISMKHGRDGGPDEDEADELVAYVSYAGGGTQSIRVSGARPPLITYPITPRGGESDAAAFHRHSRAVVKSLVEETDCTLPAKWDHGDWEDYEGIAPWEVADFANTADPAPQSE